MKVHFQVEGSPQRVRDHARQLAELGVDARLLRPGATRPEVDEELAGWTVRIRALLTKQQARSEGMANRCRMLFR